MMNRGAAAAWSPVMVWAALLFILSSVPGDSYPQIGIWNIDKLAHVAIYAVLGALVLRSLLRTGAARRGGALALAAALAAGYGVTDEIHQLFVRNRYCDWRDALADAVGGLIGAAALATARGSRPGRGSAA